MTACGGRFPGPDAARNHGKVLVAPLTLRGGLAQPPPRWLGSRAAGVSVLPLCVDSTRSECRWSCSIGRSRPARP
jgi:hypothetical protein